MIAMLGLLTWLFGAAGMISQASHQYRSLTATIVAGACLTGGWLMLLCHQILDPIQKTMRAASIDHGAANDRPATADTREG